MKKIAVFFMIMVIGVTAAACGQKKEESTAPETTVTEETDSADEAEKEEEAEAPAQLPAETPEEAEPVGETSEESPAAQVYEDNFSVDSDAYEAFAQKIKAAAADQDLEALADLTCFPVYVGLEEAGVVETREDFLKLGAEKIFTPELVESVTGADETKLSPSMAGFSLDSVGNANINFGVDPDGHLAVNGINY
ncbi:MAG: hypothetical protein KH452_07560 [Clostridiales bacterium]|nr:hypothetical protein [Clostridiales bacterium]